ncbi:hypothetical protein DOTSEDRAFT_76547 [Dothistroma septosporum NZE10]|uniref:DUF7587 domain-containing protein n=1 Tax=Dothistroma septosporum (strain NZE10 / CBS 128990) TaxID=675120 RepID=N1Q081_DOTSN|nr:hypothetical protein DOTSEDRAFT_76547 [Dothistroma septosporum NZE10]
MPPPLLVSHAGSRLPMSHLYHNFSSLTSPSIHVRSPRPRTTYNEGTCNMELFRAYSDQSHGLNNKDLFAPGAAISSGNTIRYTAPSPTATNLAQELTDALAWNKSKPSIFIFFTTSLLFATQVGRYRKQQNETNVHITCLNTKTARTPGGNPVKFWSVACLIKTHGTALTNKDGSIRDYTDVYVATDCVDPGRDALTASFNEMEAAGLYRLYPAMVSGYRSHRPRLALTTQDLREFHFQEERSLTAGQINAAAEVAAAFTRNSISETPQVSRSMSIHVLALRKRRTNDVVLTSWIQNCSIEVVDPDGDEDELSITDFLHDLPEIEQCRKLRLVFANRQIIGTALGRGIGVSKVAQEQELAEWQIWRRENIAKHREAREKRPDYVPERSSRKRHRHEQDDSEDVVDCVQQRYEPTLQPARLRRAGDRAARDASRSSRIEAMPYSFSGRDGCNARSEMPGFETRALHGRGERHRGDRSSNHERPAKRTRWW